MDTITAARRSEIMKRVRSRNTKPEMVVRRLIFALGYRYRLHVKELPGKPDLVFHKRHKVIFVHGCFWHRHTGCALARLPKSRLDFWVPKLEANRLRDIEVEKILTEMNWHVMTIWECELRDLAKLEYRIKEFLDA